MFKFLLAFAIMAAIQPSSASAGALTDVERSYSDVLRAMQAFDRIASARGHGRDEEKRATDDSVQTAFEQSAKAPSRTEGSDKANFGDEIAPAS